MIIYDYFLVPFMIFHEYCSHIHNRNNTNYSKSSTAFEDGWLFRAQLLYADTIGRRLFFGYNKALWRESLEIVTQTGTNSRAGYLAAETIYDALNRSNSYFLEFTRQLTNIDFNSTNDFARKEWRCTHWRHWYQNAIGKNLKGKKDETEVHDKFTDNFYDDLINLTVHISSSIENYLKLTNILQKNDR